MELPTFPQGAIVDEQGFMTPEFRNFLEFLLQNMRRDLSQEGFVIPSQSNTNTTRLQELVEVGTLLYNSDSNQLLIKLNDGVFHAITTS